MMRVPECPVCDRRFEDEAAVYGHVVEQHMLWHGDGPGCGMYECWCGFQTYKRGEALRHMMQFDPCEHWAERYEAGRGTVDMAASIVAAQDNAIYVGGW